MTIHFPDVSHYQEGLSLKGAPVVIAKATQGTRYTDPAYLTFKRQAAAMAAPFVAYHWLDTSDAAAQARHCHAVVGDTPLMIDDEQQRIVVSHTLAFVRAYRALGGRVVLEYAPEWVWRNSGRPNLAPLVEAGLHIVSSRYTVYSDTGPGWSPYGGITPTVWQYADNRPFNGRRVDFNAFHGTAADFAALIAGTPTTTPPEEDDDMTPAQEAKLTDLLNIVTGLAHGVDKVTVHDRDGQLSLAGLYQRIGQTQVLEQVQAQSATLTAIATALASSGGNPDTAPVLAAISGLHDQLAALAAENNDLREKLAAALDPTP